MKTTKNPVIENNNCYNNVGFKHCLELFITFFISGLIIDFLGGGIGLYSIFKITDIPIRYELILPILLFNFLFSMSCFLLLLRKNILILGPIVGILIAFPGISLLIFNYISFISIAWHLILGISFITIKIFKYLLFAISSSPNEKRREYCLAFLKILLQGVLALGTILGVMLSFIFRGGNDNLNRLNKAMGFQIIIGFMITVIILYIWIGIDLLKEIYNATNTDNT